MASFGNGGRNPAFGRDNGPPPPPGSRPGFGGYSFGFPHQYGALTPFSALNFFAQPAQFPWVQGPASYGPMGQQSFMQGGVQSTAFAAVGAAPSASPVTDSLFPAASLTNSTGGNGCEPGYNYFFPGKHTKIHVLRTGDTPPWLLPANFTVQFHSVHVPVTTTLGQLMAGFGATNPIGKKNKIIEVHQGGNGTWYKGQCYKGDNEKKMETAIKEFGWDETRTGMPGGKPVVHVYVTKG